LISEITTRSFPHVNIWSLHVPVTYSLSQQMRLVNIPFFTDLHTGQFILSYFHLAFTFSDEHFNCLCGLSFIIYYQITAE
jgi:hypothetical protein